MSMGLKDYRFIWEGVAPVEDGPLTKMALVSASRHLLNTIFMKTIFKMAAAVGHGAGALTCKIGPSILNADLSNLRSESDRLLQSGADFLHLDVMDGHFVPNLTFGHTMVSCLRRHIPNAFFDMHMMVSRPEQWVQEMSDCGATQYTFHIEAVEKADDVKTLIRKIREANMKVGIGVKPNTEIEAVLPYIDDVDMVLVMTVEPGFGGQSFMPNMMAKVRELRKRYAELDIEVDGGVSPDTIHSCAEAGANMIVSGSAVTSSDNPKKVIDSLRRSVVEAISRSALNPI